MVWGGMVDDMLELSFMTIFRPRGRVERTRRGMGKQAKVCAEQARLKSECPSGFKVEKKGWKLVQ